MAEAGAPASTGGTGLHAVEITRAVDGPRGASGAPGAQDVSPFGTPVVRGPVAPDRRALPSAVPSFLEACEKLAGEATARGDFNRARDLMEIGVRVTALPTATNEAGAPSGRIGDGGSALGSLRLRR